MYRKALRVFLVITIFLTSGPIVFPSPVQAGRMTWTPVDTPSNQFNVIVSPSEINAMAVAPGGGTIYAVDTANSRLYRSDNAGTSWLDISNTLVTAGAAFPAWNIAIAPDNPQFVVVVMSTGGLPRRVFASVDGGQNWTDTGLTAAANINAIAVSPLYGNYDIAAGTRTGAGGGTVYTYRTSGIGGTWVAQGLAGDVLSLRFSPSYKSDSSLAVLYSTAAGTFFNVGLRDLSANTTNWNAIYSGNPPEISTNGTGTSPKASQIIMADMELPLDFSGQAPSLCRAYISTDCLAAAAGIFRVDNNTVYQLMTALPNKRISSIAYYGTYASGKLLAGEVTGDPVRATVMTWFTNAPQTCPTTCWYAAEKPPTGAGTSGYGNAQVYWTPDASRAFCGTSSALMNGPAAWPGGYLNNVALDESAFSISLDNGRIWNQLSLIDTQINSLSDVAVSPDSNTVYLASINTAGAGLDSIWRSSVEPTGRSWERVLCLGSNTNDLILRMSNYGNDQVVLFASRGSDDLRQSQDSGQSWKALLPGMNVSDFSVTTTNNTRLVYVLGGIMMRKCNVTSLIPQWTQATATTLMAAHTVFAAPTGVVVVGGDLADNRVAYSLDGGISFTVTAPLTPAGRMHVLADYRFREGVIIYAASDSAGSDIYNWIIGEFTWQPMSAPSQGFWGLAQTGTLYGSSSTAVDRTLYPQALGPPAIEWSVLNTGLTPGVVFTREPLSLKLSSGINLWAIDNRPYNYPAGIGRLWNFCDCMSPTPQYTPPPQPTKEELFAPPLPVAPATGYTVPIYITDGAIQDIDFTWRPSTTALAYELWLAGDSSFSQILTQKTITPQNRRAPAWRLTDKTGLEQGKAYYWKIRIVQAANGEKGTGPWSETMSFNISQYNPEPAETPVTQPVITENQTTQPGRPVVPGQIAAADNQTTAQSFTSFLNGNLWLWILILVFIIAVVIAFILGRRAGRKI